MERNRFVPAARRLMALALLVVLGCSGGRKDFSPEAFATIKPGMPEAKVIETLGKPSETVEAAGVRRLFWETQGKYYSISFGDGKVVAPLAHANKEDYVMMMGFMKMATALKGDPPATTPSPSGAVALSADLPKLQPKGTIKLPASEYREVADVQLTKDGQRLAVVLPASTKSKTQIWDLTGAPKLVGEFDGGRGFALSPSGTRLLTRGLFDARVYDIESKKEIAKLPMGYSFGYFRDENTLVTTERSHNFPTPSKGKITQWDIAKNADAGSFEIPDDRFNGAFLTKNGKELWLFMSHDKFEVECYDLDAKKLARTIKPESDEPKPYTSAGIYQTVAPDSSAFGSDVRKFHIYDAATGKIIGGLPAELWASPTGFLPTGTRYAARPSRDAFEKMGFKESDTILYDWKNRKPQVALTGHGETKKGPVVAVSGDGNTALSVTESGEGLLYDITKWK